MRVFFLIKARVIVVKVNSIPSIAFCSINNKTKASKYIIFHCTEGQHNVKWGSIATIRLSQAMVYNIWRHHQN